MKNLLKLHEAIAIILLSKNDRTASLEEISRKIADRNLYRKKSGEFALPEQIRLRTHPNTKSGKQYSHLFKFIEPDKVTLVNIMLSRISQHQGG